MRDILDLLQILTESTGLAGRKPGDLFRNPNGEEITFNEITFYPEGGGKLDPDALTEMIEQVETQVGTIQWQNARTAKSGGFGVVSFTGDDGEFYIGRYFEQIKASSTDNYIPNAVGDFKFAGKAAAKAQAGLSPQDLLTDKLDLDVASIMNQLATSLGTDHPLYAVAHKLAMGDPLPITFPAPKDISFSAFRDYFCEIIQPIALQRGQYTGNAGEAAEAFLDGTFEDTLISFDDSKTAGLSDSIMVNPSGKTVKISTKGGKGATASAKNLLDSIEVLEQTAAGKKLLKRYKEVIDMLHEIKEQGQGGAPLFLGVKYGIITEDDARQIQNLKNSSLANIANVKTLGLSKNLQRIATARNTDNPDKVNLYYHLIAAVAHQAAAQVNDKTDFSKAAADILNNGALVQVYTKAKEGKETWTLNEFNTVYPGDSIKGVYLSAGKTYYSTGIKGNFTFKIDKGNGKPKDTDVDTAVNKPIPVDDAEFMAHAADIVGGPKRSAKDSAVSGEVGRKKRK